MMSTRRQSIPATSLSLAQSGVFALPAWRALAARHADLLMALGLVALALLLRAPAATIGSVDWDEGVYIAMAHQWLAGGLPYVAVWDQHPAGVAAILAVMQLLVHDPVAGARLAASLAVALTALMIHRFAARHAGRPLAGVAAAALYIVCSSRWLGLAANTEVFNCACVSLAACLLYGAANYAKAGHTGWGGAARAIAAALVLGVGLQVKYVVVADAALLCLFYLAIRRQCGAGWLALAGLALVLMAAGLAPTLGMAGYFAAHGALAPFLDANIGANARYLGIPLVLSAVLHDTASGLAPVAGAALVALAAIALLLRRAPLAGSALRLHSPAAWLAVWTAGAFINAALPLKFFSHYWIDTYPPLCLAAVLALATLAAPLRAAPRLAALATGLAIAFAATAPSFAAGELRAVHAARSDASRLIAADLRAAGAQGDDTFVYDYQPVIYALANLRPPTPYVLGSELAEFTHSSGVNGAAELTRILDAQPRFVVLRERKPGETGPAALDALVASRLGAYTLVRQVIDGDDGATIDLYERQAEAAPAA